MQEIELERERKIDKQSVRRIQEQEIRYIYIYRLASSCDRTNVFVLKLLKRMSHASPQPPVQKLNQQ